MVNRLIPAMAILLLSAACAGHQEQIGAMCPITSHRCTNHDVRLTWNSVKTETGMCIEGTITNNRDRGSYKTLDLTAELLDDREKVMSKGTVHFREWFKGPEKFRIELNLGEDEWPKSLKLRYSQEKEVHTYVLRHLAVLP